MAEYRREYWQGATYFFTQVTCDRLNLETRTTPSRKARRERNLWQRRFWEHRVRDEEEFAAYCDYIHINPVKHGLCKSPTDWPWSSIHRFIQKGIYPPDWGR